MTYNRNNVRIACRMCVGVCVCAWMADKLFLFQPFTLFVKEGCIVIWKCVLYNINNSLFISSFSESNWDNWENQSEKSWATYSRQVICYFWLTYKSWNASNDGCSGWPWQKLLIVYLLFVLSLCGCLWVWDRTFQTLHDVINFIELHRYSFKLVSLTLSGSQGKLKLQGIFSGYVFFMIKYKLIMVVMLLPYTKIMNKLFYITLVSFYGRSWTKSLKLAW